MNQGSQLALVLLAIGLLAGSKNKKRRNAYYRASWWF